jgi:hypothetical protein
LTAGSDKPTVLPVPAGFAHSKMGVGPRLRFRAHANGTSHALCIDATKTRLSIVWTTLLLVFLFALLALFGRVFISTSNVTTWFFIIASPIITTIWLFAFVPPLVAAHRLAKRVPVWCEIDKGVCLHIAGEPINQPVARVLHVLCKPSRNYLMQWQVQLTSGEYRLLYHDQTSVFGDAAINSWARSAGFPVCSVEVIP